MRRMLFVLLFVLIGPSITHAVQPDEILADPKLEQRARSLTANLRCLVCQNQSIDDSDAPLARDLRVLVRERLKAGDSDNDVMKFVVARYGDFILLKPPFKMETVLLWALPALILLLGGLAILYNIRRRTEVAAIPLSADEESKLRDILDRNAP